MLLVYDSSGLPNGANADVLSYGYSCGAICFNKRNDCTNPRGCHSITGVYYTDLRLDI